MVKRFLAHMVACALVVFAAFNAGAAEKIRLLFVFDKGAMDYISQAGADYDEFAASCVTRMNTVLTNSRLNDYFTYELAGTTLLPGVDNTNPATGYTEGWAALCGNRGDEWAEMLNDRYNNAADVVVLLINTGSYAGATGNSHPFTSSGAEYAINYAGSAFSVCSIMTAAREIQGIASGHQVLSHEVAHTLGCGHPDTQDRQPGPQSTSYASGMQFRLPDGKETALPPSASVTQDVTAYYGTTLMGYSERFFKHADGTYMTLAEVLDETGWTDAGEGVMYWDNTDGVYGSSYPNGVWTYCYIVPYFSSPNLYFSNVTVPYGMELTDGVVTVYDQAQYDAMSAEDKTKVVPMGDATHNNRQVLIDNYQYASRWHLGVKFSKEGSDSVVNGASDKISLAALSKNCTIYYTTDGTEPTKENGTEYTAPFSLTAAATIKARSYDSNGKAGDVLSKSYTMLPLGAALGNTELTWTVGDYPWYNNNGVARSGNINDDGVSSTLSTVITGPAKLTFEYVAELMDTDTLTVNVGGEEVFKSTGYKSEQTSSGEILIPAGNQTVEFVCTVNFSMGYGMNHVNLYNVAVEYDYNPGIDDPEDPETPAVDAPEAVAVWDGDFRPSELGKFSGYELVDWNTTHGGVEHEYGATEGVDYSDATITQANHGLMFRSKDVGLPGITVLVRYSNLQPSTSKRVLFTSTIDSEYKETRTGIRLGANGKIKGLWGNVDWDDDTEAESGQVDESGVMAFSYGASGTCLYAGSTASSLSEIRVSPGLMVRNDSSKSLIRGASIGGYGLSQSATGYEAAKGMTISGLAFFTNVLSLAEMKAYVWPTEIANISVDADTTASALNEQIAALDASIRKIVVTVAADATIEVDEALYSTVPVHVKSEGAITLTGDAEHENAAYDNFDFTGVIGGMTFVVKKTIPEPTVVWEAGEFHRTKNGYSIALNGNTIDADKNIAIDGASSSGPTIKLSDVAPNTTKITVLYKYKTMTAPNDADCRYAVSTCYESSSAKIDMGFINWSKSNPGLLPAWHKNNGTTQWDNAFYKNTNDKPAYTSAMSADGGYVLFSFSQDAKTLAGYQGDSISSLDGGVKDGITFSGYNKLTYIGLGGPTGQTASNKWGAWGGLVIEKVAIFVGEALSNEDIAGYEFPDNPPVLPELNDDTAEAVVEAVESVAFADSAVADIITNAVDAVGEYNAFKSWANAIEGGEAAVVANQYAAAAYVLGATTLFENKPEVEISEAGLDAATSTMTLTVKIKDGNNLKEVASAKVKELFEATSDLRDWTGGKLTPTVTDLTEGQDSTLQFAVKPGDGTSPSAFMRIRK